MEDYKPVAGVLMPFRKETFVGTSSVHLNDKKFVYHLRKVEVNLPLEDSLFQRP